MDRYLSQLEAQVISREGKSTSLVLKLLLIAHLQGSRTEVAIGPSSEFSPSFGDDGASLNIHNPLEQDVVQLSISPSGQRRMFCCPRFDVRY